MLLLLNSARKGLEEAIISTVDLGQGWLKQTRKRLKGKKQGDIYATFYNKADGACYTSRKKAEEAGAVINAPDGRSKRRRSPKAKPAPKRKAKAKPRQSPNQPESGSEEE